MRRRLGLTLMIACSVGAAALAPVASALEPAAPYTQPLVTQKYHCSTPVGDISARVGVTGTVSGSGSSLDLKNVTYSFLNNFGVDITIKKVMFGVPDPDRTNAPYKNGTAAVSKTPPGWTAGHTTADGIYELHKGTLDVPDGTTISVARLSATYTKRGPKGTLIEWKPGPLSFFVTTPDPGTIACTPSEPVRTFASVTE